MEGKLTADNPKGAWTGAEETKRLAHEYVDGKNELERKPLPGERGASDSSSTDAASANVSTSKSSISGEQSGSASSVCRGCNKKL